MAKMEAAENGLDLEELMENLGEDFSRLELKKMVRIMMRTSSTEQLRKEGLPVEDRLETVEDDEEEQEEQPQVRNEALAIRERVSRTIRTVRG
jgi:hypothetical protein